MASKLSSRCPPDFHFSLWVMFCLALGREPMTSSPGKTALGCRISGFRINLSPDLEQKSLHCAGPTSFASQILGTKWDPFEEDFQEVVHTMGRLRMVMAESKLGGRGGAL